MIRRLSREVWRILSRAAIHSGILLRRMHLRLRLHRLLDGGEPLRFLRMILESSQPIECDLTGRRSWTMQELMLSEDQPQRLRYTMQHMFSATKATYHHAEYSDDGVGPCSVTAQTPVGVEHRVKVCHRQNMMPTSVHLTEIVKAIQAATWSLDVRARGAIGSTTSKNS